MSAGIRSGVHWMRLLVQAQHDAQCFDQPGLGQAGNADQQHVAAGQKRDQRQIDDLLLAEDDPADPVANDGEAPAQRFHLGQQLSRIFATGGPMAHCIGSGQIRVLLWLYDTR